MSERAELEKRRDELAAELRALEAELLEGRHRLTALREDLERVRSLSSET